MNARVLAIGFGEPPEPDADLVEGYLERIFLENMPIEGAMSSDAARSRAKSLAAARAPSLMAEYEAIGGSPLQEHLKAHIGRLGDELQRRGFAASTAIATQYFEPTIADAVKNAADAGVHRLVVLPMYPLCGPSTTVAALTKTAEAVASIDDWSPDLHPIGGWHRHIRYNRLRADNVRSFAEAEGIDLTDDDTEVVFSAHGTPRSYLEKGSRYDVYVEEYCATQAALLGIDRYTLGYQNHESRGVEWTEPELEAAIETIDAKHIVVEPVSFIHEQSETLSELDIELAEFVDDRGLAMSRVPVPHDDLELARTLADLVEPALGGFDDAYYGFRACQCADTPGTRCLCSPLSS